MKRLLVLLLVSLFVIGCTGRSNSNQKRHSRRAKTEKAVSDKRSGRNKKDKQGRKTPITPKVNNDTIVMVVPLQPDNDVIQNNENEIIISASKMMKPVVHKDNLPQPPSIKFDKPTDVCSREEYVEKFNFHGKWISLIIACDYDNPTVRNNSVALASMSPGSFNLGQICDVFDFCYQNWSYVNDPITEYYAKASETIKNRLNGDCDDFAILVCSMLLSIGGEARINLAYNEDKGHAFTEVNIGTTNRNEVENYIRARYGNTELWYREEGENWWLNLDWQGRYPGAKYWDYKRGQCINILRRTYEDL